jgi:hypothetical protein
MNGPTARLNKIFFLNSYQWVIFPKFGWILENNVRYWKQYIFFFILRATHSPLFLSIIFNWSIEVKLNLCLKLIINFYYCVIAWGLIENFIQNYRSSPPFTLPYNPIRYPVLLQINKGGAKKCIHILRMLSMYYVYTFFGTPSI